MTETAQYDREAWLTEAAAFLLDDLIMPIVQDMGAPYDRPPIRVSVGFPTGRTSRRHVAVCYRREASADGHNEIFVSPTMDDSLEILAALVHELIHAVDDCQSGHRNFFAHVARRVGLVGPLTATKASASLSRELDGYVSLLGAIPHARLNTKERRKDGTRMLKCQCQNCGFVFRTTAKWVNAISVNRGRAVNLECLNCNADAVELAV